MTSPGEQAGVADSAAVLLVGREREQALLGKHLAAVLAGRGGLAPIGGEAGIDKTALAGALGREAEGQGALVLVGRSYDLSETTPGGGSPAHPHHKPPKDGYSWRRRIVSVLPP